MLDVMRLRSRTILTAAIGCALALTPPAFAADGDLDTSFGEGGLAKIDRSSEVTRIALQPDGKVIAAGQVPGGDINTYVTRLDENGAVDTSFGTNGYVTLGPPGGMGIGPVAVQPDGRILVSGIVNPLQDGDAIVFRLLPNGSIDNSFSGDGQVRLDYGNGGGWSDARGLFVQPNGRIVVAGTNYSGDNGNFGAAMFMPNGSPAPDFMGGTSSRVELGGDREDVLGAVFQDGRIILVGRSNFERGTSTENLQFAVLALNPSGSPSPSFGPGGVVKAQFGEGSAAFDAIRTRDGGLLVTGAANTNIEGGDKLALLKLDEDGAPDTGFSADGRATLPLRAGVTAVETATGEFAVSTTSEGGFAIAKVSTDGTLVPSFGSGGVATYPHPAFSTHDLVRSGRKLLLGLSLTFDMAVARIHDAGSSRTPAPPSGPDPVPAPQLSVSGGTAFEGGLVPFTISLDRPADVPVTVDFITGDQSAVRGRDYTGRRGTVTIPVGETDATVTVGTTLDRLFEAEEQFRMELSNPVNATLDQHIGRATIVNTLRSGRCANQVIGQKGIDVLTGSPAGDLIRGRLDHDVLFGLGGDDCINGEKGDDKLYGGAGNDVVDGNSGNDEIKGDAGNDRLVGGRGFNRYSGGAGNDRIYARNGRAEIVECGPGRDWAKVDRSDRLRRCEAVIRTRG
jgi:uncharacterized delta-60 repeat protein